jgi:multiple RNA-binding domain-containing protein 1
MHKQSTPRTSHSPNAPAPPSSRLFVKNLPGTLDEASLKRKFEVFGTVSDCQIIFRGEVNRRIAFIGFMNLEDAIRAQKSLENTFLGSFRISVSFAVEKTPTNPKEGKSGTPQTAPTGPKGSERAENMSIPASEVDEKRVFVTNFPFTIGEEELSTAFANCGKVASCKIIRKNGESCGYGFVEFEEEMGAARALGELDHKTVFGRSLKVTPCKKAVAKPKDQPAQSVQVEKSSFKKLKKQKLLERLTDDTNWNSSFLNPNAVMERMAEKLGVSRKALLDNEIENPAVLRAQCEREILDEVTEFLGAHGIDPAVFTKPKGASQRSKTTLLVKNIPFKAKAGKLEELFSQYGTVESFLMPPNRAVAVIEFTSHEHANNALKSLGDYVFQGVPLYLEWAPTGLKKEEELLGKRPTLVPEEPMEESTPTVFVKNLNLTTEEADLEQFLSEKGFPDFKFVKIIRNQGKSLGYGFVEFESPQTAAKVIRKLQGALFQSHVLKLSLSKPQKSEADDAEPKDAGKPSDKLVLKNLPFQTNKQELVALIKGIVPARDIRLPKKTDGSLKGFAFVQFGSVEEAKKGLGALQSLHFYGRKLVPMFARE